MKKSAVICSLLGLIFLSTPVYADSSASQSPAPIQANVGQNPGNGPDNANAPMPRDAQGREIQDPREHNDHEDHGFMGVGISIVIGALLIAIGLAYGIGRRNSHSHHH